MATYVELRNLFDDGELTAKVEVATVIAANNLLTGTPTAAEKDFANAVFENPRGFRKLVLMAVLAANKDVTAANIQSATDAAIQSNVNAVIPYLVDARAGV